jgi:hypothetical protein
MKIDVKPHPLNVPGFFYVENGLCMACCMPQHEAPQLIGFVDDSREYHCYFKKQPENPEEIELAIQAIEVSCCGAVRYGGENPIIIQRLTQLGCKDDCDNS